MKRIKYKDIEYTSVETVWELTLGNWIDLQEVLKKPDEIEYLSTQMKMLSFVTSIPIGTIEDMDEASFQELCSVATLPDLTLPDVVTASEAGSLTSKSPISFCLPNDPEPYFFQPDFAFSKLRYIAKVEDLLRGKDFLTHLHYVLALAAWQKDEVFDPNAINDKALKMCEAQMEDIFKPLFFFVAQGQSFSRIIKLFSKVGKEQSPKRISSSVTGAGEV